jgi:hypothetical protein
MNPLDAGDGVPIAQILINIHRFGLTSVAANVTELIPAACQFPGDVPADDRGAGKF